MQNAALFITALSSQMLEAVTCCSAQDIVTGNAETIGKLLALLREKYDLDFLYQKLVHEGEGDAKEVVAVLGAPPSSPPPRPVQYFTPSTTAPKPATAAAPTTGERERQAREKVRRKVAEEVVQTEERYVDYMQSVLDHIIRLVEATSALTQGEIDSVFCNFTDLLVFHKALHLVLARRVMSWVPFSTTVGDIFLNHLEDFNMYGPYLSNYAAAMIALHFLEQRNPRFREIVELAKQRVIAGSLLHIDSFLVMPVQRLPRYTLLLDNMLKYTGKDHPDFLLLTDFVSKLNRLIDDLNKAIDPTYGPKVQKLVSIAGSIAYTSSDRLPLVAPGRWLVKEGVIGIKLQRAFNMNTAFAEVTAAVPTPGSPNTLRGSLNLLLGWTDPAQQSDPYTPPVHKSAPYCFLFNDTILYCDQRSGARDGRPFLLLAAARTAQIREAEYSNTGIRLRLLQKEHGADGAPLFDWVLVPNTPSEREQWEAAIKSVLPPETSKGVN
eukprot:TRINITY_DN7709_c0_g1_i1.p1 TRINITY_DN7709_c0_g1~~TRINITY_DN7709_c0_g1_i1.p1  ORF type:complete len:494 (-),score=118.79 TRINITY_DN7709_c0_g1_i1:22-1503(-)